GSVVPAHCTSQSVVLAASGNQRANSRAASNVPAAPNSGGPQSAVIKCSPPFWLCTAPCRRCTDNADKRPRRAAAEAIVSIRDVSIRDVSIRDVALISQLRLLSRQDAGGLISKQTIELAARADPDLHSRPQSYRGSGGRWSSADCNRGCTMAEKPQADTSQR